MDETYVVQGSLFELAERQVFQQMVCSRKTFRYLFLMITL